MRISDVSFRDLTLRDGEQSERPRFYESRGQPHPCPAKEPFKTMFSIAATTGLRAGELLALTLSDLNFRHKTIRANKSADDNTRAIRQPKTKKSVAALPMASSLEAMLWDYLAHHGKDHPKQLLFPNRRGTRPRCRDNAVKYALNPILPKPGIPDHNAGFHDFRHGLATELAEASEPIIVPQSQMGHADVRTTLKIYAHVIQHSQRDSLE